MVGILPTMLRDGMVSCMQSNSTPLAPRAAKMTMEFVCSQTNVGLLQSLLHACHRKTKNTFPPVFSLFAGRRMAAKWQTILLSCQ